MNNIYHNIVSLFSDIFGVKISLDSTSGKITLFVESIISTLISVFFCTFLDIPVRGVISIFLVSSCLIVRMAQILDVNKNDIIFLKKPVLHSNQKSIIYITIIFFGVFIGYIMASVIIADEVNQYFSFISKPYNTTLFDSHIRNFYVIWSNNMSVVIGIMFLSFVYRSFGAIITLVLNACVWAITFVSLFSKTILQYHVNDLLLVFVAICAVFPHLLLESVGYITVALCTVFFSKSISLYNFTNKTFKSILITSIKMLVFAIACLFVAALIESYYASAILSLLKSS